MAASQDLVGIGEMARALGLPVHRLRRMADAGRVPSTQTPGGHRRFDPVAVSEAFRGLVAGRRAKDALAGPPAWSSALPLSGLDEAKVWRETSGVLSADPDSKAFRIMQFAFTEMLNNAIDHSKGTTVAISLWSGADLGFQIVDDGLGAFETAREALGLKTPAEVGLEFSTGKATTDPANHSGQGIFFTSRALDLFRLEANRVEFIVEAEADDWALGISKVRRGTRVAGAVSRDTERALTSVFDRFTGDDLEFSATRPVVKLADSGAVFMSRAEAKRLVARLEQFKEVELDFQGVDSVGQGFVDEVFRVWAGRHPDTHLVPANMNPSVELMVRRGSPDVG